MMFPEAATEADVFAQAVARLRDSTGCPLSFGGPTYRDTTDVHTICGNQGRGLVGLRVQLGRGLGGRAMLERRAKVTTNYRGSSRITHDYDVQVLSEHVQSLMAVPVIVDKHVRGVLYGGFRAAPDSQSMSLGQAVALGKNVEDELRLRDELSRRMRVGSASVSELGGGGLTATQLEELRGTFSELREVASLLGDAEVRARLRGIEERLVRFAGDHGDPRSREAAATADLPEAPVRLSPRELDVLGQIALGLTNKDIARKLILTESTVKSYLGTAMTKLDAGSRYQALAKARHLGLLP
ncbi:DNA-binding CsgD family transcriptional regulator [Pseudoclavibacter sp. JAI123]|jgi:DNA-binding CsgD family transcriptional regulator|uniref:LuxR C-terminal-related transcriptional regulator n=1 Tax=Pseudoclavibacter sp. JAI123 TaxID=2723065 RepID=UPI0015C93EAC|nr:LuxR C-terminal-related transcriptional regulator [Pseudoclavibacter sp. JAI123]NYF11885.1 DNA-binding CsgD family transcriptional regulator [Pseudoclavibacter sp. JAI123]